MEKNLICPLCGRRFEELTRRSLFGRTYSVGCPNPNCDFAVGINNAYNSETAWSFAETLIQRRKEMGLETAN
jgi:hypothetical protein